MVDQGLIPRRLADGSPWLYHFFKHRFTASAVLLILLMFTGLAWKVADDGAQARLTEQFSFRTTLLQDAIERRMLEYQSVLRGGAGLFAAGGTVDRQSWRSYVAAIDVNRYFPGIQGVGYSAVIAPGDLDRHVASVRAQGFPAYDIKPPGARDVYTAVIYLEPFDARNQRAFGYDMFSEPVRRAAMETARDTGQATMSGAVNLVQETDRDIQKGFLIYMPVYRPGSTHASVDERRQALIGYVYCPFRMRDLMDGILDGLAAQVGLEIYDGDGPRADRLIYDTGLPVGHNPQLSSSVQLVIANHTWTLRFYTLPAFQTPDDARMPMMVALVGIALDLLIFLVLTLFARRHQQIEAMAAAMTVQIMEKNRDLEQFTEILAHHLQEPVRLQLTFTSRLKSLLGADGLTPDINTALTYIVLGSERLRMLLRDVQLYLALSQSPWLPRPCETAKALQTALMQLQLKIDKTKAQITSGDLPVVLIDPTRMTDLFAALIDNSLSYGQDGVPPVIAVSAQTFPFEAMFVVEDNGIGIPEKFRDRVFNVFERLSTESGRPGTGIGLALVKKIIETAHGRVWIEAGPEQGTRVCFTLPRPLP